MQNKGQHLNSMFFESDFLKYNKGGNLLLEYR